MNFFSFDQLVLTFVGQSLYSTWVILQSITEYFGWNEEKAHMNTWTQVENNWTGNKSSVSSIVQVCNEEEDQKLA